MAGRVFLIDYENVHGTGLYGIDYLDEEDYVYLFFTDQANKLELNFISDIQVPFFVRRVPCGKQSLDMHLVSYLGYLIGSEPSNDCRYFIISKDTDFDGVCQYWSYQFCIDDKVCRKTSVLCGCDEEETPGEERPPETNLDHETKNQLGHMILKNIRKYGEPLKGNVHAILLSKLCPLLNDEPIYQQCKLQTHLRPQRLLEQCFSSIVKLEKQASGIWVYDTPDIHRQLVNKYAVVDSSTVPANEAEVPMTEQPSNSEDDTAENSNSHTSDESEYENDLTIDAWIDGPSEEAQQQESIIIADEPPTNDETPIHHTDDITADLVSCELLTEVVADHRPDELRQQITQYLITAGMTPEDLSIAIDWLLLFISDTTGKRAIYQSMLTSFGRNHGLEVYNLIRETFERVELSVNNCFYKVKNKEKGRVHS